MHAVALAGMRGGGNGGGGGGDRESEMWVESFWETISLTQLLRVVFFLFVPRVRFARPFRQYSALGVRRDELFWGEIVSK